MDTRSKILPLDRFAREALPLLRAQARRIVFTNGCFDLLHAGHVEYLEKSRSLGDLLVVGLNTDASVRRLGKGPGRPLNTEADRARVLAALSCVDYVIPFDEDTPAALIAAIGPDVLTKGGDYAPDSVAGAGTVKARGGRVVIVPLLEGRSTTGLIGKMKG